jgi:dethiobiotin synthetase
MRGRVVVVTGTGTEIGKTHIAAALVRHAAVGRRVAGVKPVESGVSRGSPTDADALAAASTFHVKQSAAPYRFADPVSPHLAARRAGVTIDPARLRALIDEAATQVDLLVVELPGGLFSPLADGYLNADLARDLDPAVVALVAPDRLGVLQDIIATVTAARAVGTPVHLLILNAPAAPDASTGTNAAEVHRFLGDPMLHVVGPLPRTPAEALATHPGVADALSQLLSA